MISPWRSHLALLLRPAGMMHFLRRLGRYGQVGLVCALLSNAIVIGMDRFGYHYAVSVTVAYLAGTLVGYLLHTAYTFQVRPSGTGWLSFVVANLSGFALAISSMSILCGIIGLSASIAMPIVTVLLFAWNYLLAYWLIGRSKPRPAGLTR
jgi:putative flippase GtrA